MGDACGTGGGGSGGGGSGGCGGGGEGGELIGVAQEAVTGCCCVVPVDNGPGQCTDVANPAQCSLYNMYTDGACNPGTSTGAGACSTTGVRSGPGGVIAVDGFVLFLALAVFRVTRRRFA